MPCSSWDTPTPISWPLWPWSHDPPIHSTFFLLPPPDLVVSALDPKPRNPSPDYLFSAQLQAVGIFSQPIALNEGARFVHHLASVRIRLEATRPWDTELSITMHSSQPKVNIWIPHWIHGWLCTKAGFPLLWSQSVSW